MTVGVSRSLANSVVTRRRVGALDGDGRRCVARAGVVGVDGECGAVRSVIRGRRWGVGEREGRVDAGR